MLVSDIINIIQEQTRDDNVTWTDSDVMQYINEAVKNTIQRAPQANSKEELVDCVVGIDQTLPEDAVSIINVIANDSNTQGKAGEIIHRADVQTKDAYTPQWRRTRSSAVVVEWMKRSSPTHFLVWPPLDSGRKLLVEYSFYPPDVNNTIDNIIITNEYQEPIRAWCLYRTYSRDSEDTPNVQRAEIYKQQYEQFFGNAS